MNKFKSFFVDLCLFILLVCMLQYPTLVIQSLRFVGEERNHSFWRNWGHGIGALLLLTNIIFLVYSFKYIFYKRKTSSKLFYIISMLCTIYYCLSIIRHLALNV